MKSQSIYNFFNYFLLSAIVASTGFEYFFREPLILYLIAPISFSLFIFKRKLVPPKLLYFISLLLLIFLIQSFIFDMPYSLAFTGILRFFIYFSIASVIGSNFNRVYVKVMYQICLISLFLFISSSLFQPFYNFLLSISKNVSSLGINDETYEHWTNESQNIIIYLIPLVRTTQNSGPFWEPGMFAVFINIALAINIIANKKVLEKLNMTFIIASISTLSTASFIATFIIISYHFLLSVKSKYSIFFIFIIPFIAIPLYNSEYIKGKIDSNIETMDTSYSRFGAIFVHYTEVLKSPIVGHGANVNKSVEKQLNEYELNLSPNGLTNIFRIYGIPFTLLLYILLFKASSIVSKIAGSSNKRDAWLIFAVLLTVAFSQDVTTRHFYYLLMMIPLTKIKSLSYKN